MDMVWKPIDTAPLTDVASDEVNEILVWVADGGDRRQGCVAFGRVYRRPSGKHAPQASGYSGSWRITHWMPMPESPCALTPSPTGLNPQKQQ